MAKGRFYAKVIVVATILRVWRMFFMVDIGNATFPFPQVFSLSPFPLAREPTVTAWRGTTLGRDITNAISLIVPLRFVRRLRNNMAQSLVLYVKSDARYGRRRCGSKSVFEVAECVYKCAPLAVLFVFKLVAKVFRTRLHAFA